MAVRASVDVIPSLSWLIRRVFDVRQVVAVVLLVLAAGCARPAPVAIILATSEQESLAHYARIAEHLPGWRMVSLDLPAHGADLVSCNRGS
jgi:hypothetical protein